MNEDLQHHFFSIIDSAVTNQLVIQFLHNNTWRTVEPYMVGLHADTQTPILYSFCRDVIGSTSRWQLFQLSEIKSMELTNYGFRPHSEYIGSHDQVESVYIKLNINTRKELKKKFSPRQMAV